MGWFSSSSKLPPPKISTDGTPIAPDRNNRAKCWEGRDAFFACLNSHSIIDSTSPNGKAQASKECPKELAQFEGSCASSWVEYFKKKRVMEWQKEQAMQKLERDGAMKIPGEMSSPGSPK